MNTSRLFITLVAVLGFATSSGCSNPPADTPDSQSNAAIETDMNIVIPDSTDESPEAPAH